MHPTFNPALPIPYPIPSPTEQVLPERESIIKAIVLLCMLAAGFVLAEVAARTLPLWASVPAMFVLGLFDVAVFTGMAVLAHEAEHRVLFRNSFWNDFVGCWLSALTLIPFYANRQYHLTHHSYTHQKGLDPETRMHDRPFWQALFLGAIFGMYDQYRLVWENIRNARDPKRARRALYDVVSMGCVFTLYLVVLPALGISAWHTLLYITLAFPFAFAFRAMSDHWGLPAVEPKHRTRTEIMDADEQTDNGLARVQANAWIILTPRWLAWLWSNINYHEVHHKYPWLSHRYLPIIYHATADKYPYRVVHGYWRSLWNLRKMPYYSEGSAGR
ncbi:fatty acid desaturase family protein [Viridibacterium curvum]|uniref:Fatty acid desaturase domain-containing protein n=1 Tax=Viridibacterium curvum TaxID=1101404 RepID=A0ABP9QIY1_9RHOO